jgi:hypothetical protein
MTMRRTLLNLTEAGLGLSLAFTVFGVLLALDAGMWPLAGVALPVVLACAVGVIMVHEIKQGEAE